MLLRRPSPISPRFPSAPQKLTASLCSSQAQCTSHDPASVCVKTAFPTGRTRAKRALVGYCFRKSDAPGGVDTEAGTAAVGTLGTSNGTTPNTVADVEASEGADADTDTQVVGTPTAPYPTATAVATGTGTRVTETGVASDATATGVAQPNDANSGTSSETDDDTESDDSNEVDPDPNSSLGSGKDREGARSDGDDQTIVN